MDLLISFKNILYYREENLVLENKKAKLELVSILEFTMMKSILFVIVTLSSLSAFSSQRFGEEFDKNSLIPIKSVIENNRTYAGKGVIVSGKVDRICVKKGCWLNLGTGKDFVRVTFKDYGIFVPSNFLGKKVALKGTFDIKTESVKRRRHLMEDEGLSREEIKKVTAPTKTFSIVATGIELI